MNAQAGARARADESVLVVKIGGGIGIDREAVCADLARQWDVRCLVVLHGAAQELDRVSAALGHPPQRVTSVSGIESRFTDDATMSIFNMVYAGSAKVRWVESLQRIGVAALGLSGVDGGLLRGPEKTVLRSRLGEDRQQLVRGDRSGRVTQVNVPLLRLLLEAHYLPVISPPALSEAGRAMNVDADRAAAQVAIALGAATLVFLSDVPGLMLDPDRPETLLTDVRRHQLPRAMEVARGRMRTKVIAAAEGLQGGVRRVVLADGRTSSPVAAALSGRGTVFRRNGVSRAAE
ncbi:MAG TPA: [LysW]-aminoadipate kinase [Candidatus Dormibacteraeota bacterium]|nr:[LysW]-aminoadipate kinase [Candidatus Dormibacteraeota bacterium]